MSAAPTIERAEDAERFLETARTWLLEAEVENNLLLGMALNWRGREPTDPHPYWLLVREKNEIVACAFRTPPHPLVLSRTPIHAVAALAADLRAADPALSGVTGPIAEAEAFANAWTRNSGGRWTTRLRLRLHELTQLSPPAVTPPGSLRTAADTDLVLAREWIAAYVRDTGLHAPSGDVAQRLIDRKQLYLWFDGRDARAMVAATRDTGSGCSINTVYTPPRFRRQGYASGAVAALSATLLEGGRRFCCLYTDAANPTSNSIYAKLGYRPIRDDVELVFQP